MSVEWANNLDISAYRVVNASVDNSNFDAFAK